jgi:hypothetical protein
MIVSQEKKRHFFPKQISWPSYTDVTMKTATLLPIFLSLVFVLILNKLKVIQGNASQYTGSPEK